jgi:outer membrane protein TolC
MNRQHSKRCTLFAVAWLTLLIVTSAAGQQFGTNLPGFRKTPAAEGPKHLTLEQAQQQAAEASSPLARLGQLSVEAAKQHRLGAQADYFPKISATLSNVHFNKFMGEEIAVRRPIAGTTATVGIPLAGKDQTLAAVIVAQPITPLFKIHEAVNLARADERIARAKAGMSVSETASAVEKNYYSLLVAQRQLALAEASAKKLESGRMIASSTPVALDLGTPQADAMEPSKGVAEASGKVKQLTASLNELLGWSPDTELKLEPPSPLVENLTFKEAADQTVAANSDVIEAEQNVAKARAASKLSKLDYVPDVAAMWGYVYNGNALPALPRDFSFIGVMVSYNVFDFGKREHTVKERNAQVGMAEAALDLAKAKASGGLKQSYFELERSRRLSEMAHQMESTMHIIDVKYAPDDPDLKASRTKLEIEMLQADLEYRQAYAKVTSLMGNKQGRH